MPADTMPPEAAEPAGTAGLRHPRPTVEGPALPRLVQRLALTPPDVLDPGAHVPALVGDAVDLLALSVPGPWQLDADARAALDRTCGPDAPAPARAGAGIVCWLARAPEVTHLPHLSQAAPDGPATWFLAVVDALAHDLAGVRDPQTWVSTPEGREEAARAFLRAAGLRPAGESDAVADDRWSAVSTAEQQRLDREMAEEVRRSEELAKALASRRAAEAAAQYANY